MLHDCNVLLLFGCTVTTKICAKSSVMLEATGPCPLFLLPSLSSLLFIFSLFLSFPSFFSFRATILSSRIRASCLGIAQLLWMWTRGLNMFCVSLLRLFYVLRVLSASYVQCLPIGGCPDIAVACDAGQSAHRLYDSLLVSGLVLRCMTRCYVLHQAFLSVCTALRDSHFAGRGHGAVAPSYRLTDATYCASSRGRTLTQSLVSGRNCEVQSYGVSFSCGVLRDQGGTRCQGQHLAKSVPRISAPTSPTQPKGVPSHEVASTTLGIRNGGPSLT